MQMRYQCPSVVEPQDVGDTGKRLVAIVPVEAVGRSRASQVRGCHQEINKRVIVKVTEECLDPEIINPCQPGVRTDIGEET